MPLETKENSQKSQEKEISAAALCDMRRRCAKYAAKQSRMAIFVVHALSSSSLPNNAKNGKKRSNLGYPTVFVLCSGCGLWAKH